MMEKKSTIFCDIDGTIFKYRKFETYESSEPEVLPQVVEKIKQWRSEGHMVVLTTARPHYLWEHTEQELAKNDVEYDRLVMEIERGPRIVINDMDPNKPGLRAMGVNLNRDTGFEGTNWEDYGL